MSRYVLAPEAREDLKSIYRYIARDNPPAAGRLRKVFLAKFRMLAQQPLMGQARDDLAQDLRMFPAGNYVILYRARSDGIDVVQVVHSAQDIGAVLRQKKQQP